jgi:uncharacterized protein with von Willebrand factor type A (vWA) domain
MRESLQLGGEPLRLRRLGHPLRNPRVIVLIDGSRSMTEHANDVLGFADALVRRSLRARVFAFSTEVRDITHDVRRGALPQLGPAWGGGTRIGESFRSFVRRYGAVLDDNTVVLVFSDGLDFGDCNVVANAAQTLRRRSAALVWLSPNAGVPGYVPATQAMRAVLPSLTALVGASEFRKLVRIAQRL